MTQLIRWKKAPNPWTNWHLTDDDAMTLCGIHVPDETCGTSFKKQTMLEGKVQCKRCDYSYFGLMPQFRRIKKGLQSTIHNMRGDEEE